MQKFAFFTLAFLFHIISCCQSLNPVIAQGQNTALLKCLVCEKIFEEVKVEIDKPKLKGRTVAVGGYHLDDKGNTNQRTVPYHQSDVFLNEVLDSICERMKDYVRVRRKRDDKLIIMPLVLGGGMMNPDFGQVDPILDDDLNKSLEHYCHDITSEDDEEIIATLKKTPAEDIDGGTFCSTVLSHCVGVDRDLPSQDDGYPNLEDIIGKKRKEEF